MHANTYEFKIGTLTKYRLARYRKEASEGKWVRPLTWRDTRKHHPNIWATPNNVTRDGKLFSDSVDQIGDYLGHCSDLLSRDYGAWYADNYQDDILTGGVCRMRTSKCTMYIPVTSCTAWDGTIHYLCDAVMVDRGSDQDTHDDAIRDAARMAHECARIEAEEAREEDAKYLAEQDIEQARTDIHDINKACLALLREIKQHGEYSVAVCSALRAQVMSMLADRAKQFRIINERQDNYWSAVPY